MSQISILLHITNTAFSFEHYINSVGAHNFSSHDSAHSYLYWTNRDPKSMDIEAGKDIPVRDPALLDDDGRIKRTG